MNINNKDLVDRMFNDCTVIENGVGATYTYSFIANTEFSDKDKDIKNLEDLGFHIKYSNYGVEISGYQNVVDKNEKEYSEQLKKCEKSSSDKKLGKFLQIGAVAIGVVAVAAIAAATVIMKDSAEVSAVFGSVGFIGCGGLASIGSQVKDPDVMDQAKIIVTERLKEIYPENEVKLINDNFQPAKDIETKVHESIAGVLSNIKSMRNNIFADPSHGAKRELKI